MPETTDMVTILDAGPRIAGGVLLEPAQVTALVAAAHARWPALPAEDIRCQIDAYLATYIIHRPTRVLWDCQRAPLVAALTGLAGKRSGPGRAAARDQRAAG